MARAILSTVAALAGLAALGGCATQKESHTARTGVEQLLISSAVDQALDKIDLKPLQGRNVFFEAKYLDCVDKNYIIVSMHQRLLATGAKLVDKPEQADSVVEVSSGGVGTDSQELFVGVPEIPLAPPSPIAIPKLSLLSRSRLNGTAKILVVAYDARTRAPVLANATALARSDQNNWNVLGSGPVQTGVVPDQIAAATGQTDLNVLTVANMARNRVVPAESKPGNADGQQIQPAVHEKNP